MYFFWSTLRNAVSRGDLGTVCTTLETGRAIRLPTGTLIGQAVMSRAAEGGHLKIVQLLLHMGGDPNVQDQDSDGWTPLLWAVKEQHKAIVVLLLETGACSDFIAADGTTAMSLAAQTFGHEITRILLQAK